MTDPTTRPCGAGHARYPETVCTEPAGHTGAHAGRFTVDGRVGGAAAWGGADAATDPTGAAVCPLEAPAGAGAGMESPEGVAGAQADTGAAQAARWSRREQLGVLLSRMQRGVLLDAERPLLRAAVETELADADQAHADLQRMADLVTAAERTRQHQAADADRYEAQLRTDLAEARAERDRARRIAVELEQKVAAVTALHVHNADADYCDICSNHGDTEWPCATIRALDPQENH